MSIDVDDANNYYVCSQYTDNTAGTPTVGTLYKFNENGVNVYFAKLAVSGYSTARSTCVYLNVPKVDLKQDKLYIAGAYESSARAGVYIA